VRYSSYSLIDGYNGVAISNHQCKCFIEFNNCQETTTTDNNQDDTSPGKDRACNNHNNNVISGENVCPGEDDEDESNAWVPPDEECLEGSTSSYVSDDGDDVPFLPFDEYDAIMKCWMSRITILMHWKQNHMQLHKAH